MGLPSDNPLLSPLNPLNTKGILMETIYFATYTLFVPLNAKVNRTERKLTKAFNAMNELQGYIFYLELNGTKLHNIKFYAETNGTNGEV